LHHETFDLGAFSLGHKGVVFMSDQTNGTVKFHEELLRHDRQECAGTPRP